jgi:hypothetical protein
LQDFGSMSESDSAFEHVEGGRIEAWLRDDGLFGVSLLPDSGGGHSYTSAEGHDGFPAEYDSAALLAWGRARWQRDRG